MMATANTRGAERLRVAWETHKDKLWRAVWAWSGDREIASDAVAEAFAQAARRGDAIEDVGRWVWRAAFRIAGGLLADRRRDSAGDSNVERRDADTLPDEVVVLLDLLDRLTRDDRAVVVLAHVGGWSAGQIAELTGSTAGAVRVRLHRARRRLRRALEERDD
jgi:RNA polymerase sigma-70 factor (ECF subfamily)